MSVVGIQSINLLISLNLLGLNVVLRVKHDDVVWAYINQLLRWNIYLGITIFVRHKEGWGPWILMLLSYKAVPLLWVHLLDFLLFLYGWAVVWKLVWDALFRSQRSVSYKLVYAIVRLEFIGPCHDLLLMEGCGRAFLLNVIFFGLVDSHQLWEWLWLLKVHLFVRYWAKWRRRVLDLVQSLELQLIFVYFVKLRHRKVEANLLQELKFLWIGLWWLVVAWGFWTDFLELALCLLQYRLWSN